MVAYNFQPRFIPAVSSGQKCQTIRAIGKRRHARPGELVQLYTGMRTRNCQKLIEHDPTCIKVMPVSIASGVTVDGLTLIGGQVDAFAIADGFDSAEEFFDFFRRLHSSPFEGVVIVWEPQRSSTAQ